MSESTGEILKRLRNERLIVLTRDESRLVFDGARIVAQHGTLGEGDLTVLLWGDMVLVVEQADGETFVLRRFADEHEADLFVRRRLDQYERMWDGCGCRIDYYEEQ